MVHTGLWPQKDFSHRKAAAFFIKRTWCIKAAKCKKKPCSLRCYVSKQGRCLMFRRLIWRNDWIGSMEGTKNAWALYKTAEFDDCSKEAEAAAHDTIAAA